MSFKIRRGTDAERLLITPLEGELIYATDTMKVYVGDGSTAGGVLVTGGGDGGGTGYNGSKGYNGSTGLAATIAVGSVNTGAPGSAVLVTNSGSSSAATFNFTIPSGFSGSRGEAGLQGGTLVSDLDISTYNIINSVNLTINGTTGGISSSSITAGGLSLNNNTITSSSTFTSGLSNTIGKININDRTSVYIRSTDHTFPYFRIYSTTATIPSDIGPYTETNASRGSINVPTVIQAGDWLGNIRYRAHDGSAYQLSSSIGFIIDSDNTVSTGHVPGKIIFSTIPDGNALNSKNLVWDSKGRLGVNKYLPTETLDVDGTAAFTGYIVFGSYTTTQRDALTARNGMVIYNTSDGKFQGRQAGAWVNFV